MPMAWFSIGPMTTCWKTSHKLGWALLTGVGAVVALLAAVVMAQHKLIYRPRLYPSRARKPAFGSSQPLRFETDDGHQYAFYVAPTDGQVPRRLWLMFAGNAGLALEWLEFVAAYGDRSACGFLLVDYPGYGMNEGSPSPRGMLANSVGAVDALALHLGLTHDELVQQCALGAVGHSLGAAAALQWARAAAFHVDRVVLISPFTSLSDMARHLLGPVPLLSYLLKHRFDNRLAVAQFIHRRTQAMATVADRNATVAVVHGDQDELIPVSMGRELARFATSCCEKASLLRDWMPVTDNSGTTNHYVRVMYRELSGATHNGILSTHRQTLTRLLCQLEP